MTEVAKVRAALETARYDGSILGNCSESEHQGAQDVIAAFVTCGLDGRDKIALGLSHNPLGVAGCRTSGDWRMTEGTAAARVCVCPDRARVNRADWCVDCPDRYTRAETAPSVRSLVAESIEALQARVAELEARHRGDLQELAIGEALRDALLGEPVSDFFSSFEIVRRALDLKARHPRSRPRNKPPYLSSLRPRNWQSRATSRRSRRFSIASRSTAPDGPLLSQFFGIYAGGSKDSHGLGMGRVDLGSAHLGFRPVANGLKALLRSEIVTPNRLVVDGRSAGHSERLATLGRIQHWGAGRVLYEFGGAGLSVQHGRYLPKGSTSVLQPTRAHQAPPRTTTDRHRTS